MVLDLIYESASLRLFICLLEYNPTNHTPPSVGREVNTWDWSLFIHTGTCAHSVTTCNTMQQALQHIYSGLSVSFQVLKLAVLKPATPRVLVRSFSHFSFLRVQLTLNYLDRCNSLWTNVTICRFPPRDETDARTWHKRTWHRLWAEHKY